MSTSPRIRSLTPCSQVDPCEQCGHMAVSFEDGYRICKKCGWVYEKCQEIPAPQTSQMSKSRTAHSPTRKEQEQMFNDCCSFPVFIREYFPYILLSASIVVAIALTIVGHIAKA